MKRCTRIQPGSDCWDLYKRVPKGRTTHAVVGQPTECERRDDFRRGRGAVLLFQGQRGGRGFPGGAPRPRGPRQRRAPDRTALDGNVQAERSTFSIGANDVSDPVAAMLLRDDNWTFAMFAPS